MLTVLTMEYYFTCLIAFLTFPKASTVILEGPRSGVYPEGTNITLQCFAEGSHRIVWEDVTENTVIFIDKAKNTQKAKFDNFIISEAKGNFSLTIVNAQLSDDGFYSCEEGDDSRNAKVTVEAPPMISISLNNIHNISNNSISLTEDDMVTVVCKAEGAKPAVDVRLKFGRDEWIKDINSTQRMEGLRFTTESKFVHRVTITDKAITCEAKGQSSPFSKNVNVNVIYTPICKVQFEKGIAKCLCDSNPVVFTYKIFVDGDLKSTNPRLDIRNYETANITCFATNEVGTGVSNSIFVAPEETNNSTAIVIIIAAVIIFVILTCALLMCICCKRSKKTDRLNEDDVEENLKLSDHSPEDSASYNKAKSDGEGTKPLLAKDEEHVDDDVQVSTAGDVCTLPPPPTEGLDNQTNSKKDGEDVRLPAESKETVNEFQDFIAEISTTIHRDWEILAVEQLRLEKVDVQKIAEEKTNCTDQVKNALESWAKSCIDQPTKIQLAKVLSKSDVCNDFRSNDCMSVLRDIEDTITHHHTLNEGTGGETVDKKSPKDPKLEVAEGMSTAGRNFNAIIENVAKVIGNTGALKLLRTYNLHEKDPEVTGLDRDIRGEEITIYLVDNHLLEDTTKSLTIFKKQLRNCFLFRAIGLVDAYIKHKDPELTQLISKLVESISHDWEILAIEDLLLAKNKVEEIIKEYSHVSDQLVAALELWITSFEGEATKVDLEKILKKSKVYGFYCDEVISKHTSSDHSDKGGIIMSHKNENDTDELGEQVLKVATFPELLNGVGKYVGYIGAHRLSNQYQEVTVDTFTDEQFAVLTGESLIKFLIDKGLLTDEIDSLRKLKKALSKSLLLQARNQVDTYISEREKKIVTKKQEDRAINNTNLGTHSGTDV